MDSSVIVILSEREELNVVKRSFKTSSNILEYSSFFTNVISEGEIRIPADARIRDYILELVIKFLEFRFEHPEMKEQMDKMALDLSNSEIMAEEDREFFSKLDIPSTIRMLLAANYLQIDPISAIAKKTLANMIKTKKVSELKSFFAFPENATDDEREP